MDQRALLNKLNEYEDTHSTCPLKETATQAVYGDGNPQAACVFIGEAPGKAEDISGKPFVGASGKLLSELLESIHIKREDIYITNLVKYRPPDNRDPLPVEVESCRRWLLEELNIIKPRVIIFLGRHAMKHFFPLEKISDIHGKLITKEIPGISTQLFLPLYHPAAALYNGSLRESLFKDITMLKQILKNASEMEAL